MNHREWRETLVDNNTYYFDSHAADRAVSFIEKYLTHYEDPYDGQPFLLMDWQKAIVRDIFGWKRRDNGRRRFREVYFEIPKGNGKSPLMAAIGMYMFLAEKTAGAYVVSAATGYEQAKITFDAAKRMIEASQRLLNLCGQPLETKIKGPRNSQWRIVSGTPDGKAGPRPTCCIFDEVHEWANRKMYASLSRNAKKRPNSLILVATNSGNRKDSVCWELHDKAQRVLNGQSKADTLYPVIYSSSEKDDPFDPRLWARVNPALDVIISSATLKEEAAKARENPADEADFRRLHCGQWVSGTEKWVDMSAYDACTRSFKKSEVAALPLVVGLDMSLNDDLTALDLCWRGDDTLYTRCKFWLPLVTAQRYEQRDGTPFAAWSRDKHIRLIDSPTIDARAQQRLAKYIIGLRDSYDLRAVCYDRNRASNVIALCEQAGIVCIPVPQDWHLSPALEEIERRLKDRSIVIAPSPVMRWNASNVEASYDAKGNLHIKKEGAAGTYKGRRSSKHDGISALATALSQVLREQMTPAKAPSVYESRGVFVL